MKKDYKTLVVEPKGIRVKGDDHSDTLASLTESKLNLYSADGWKLVSVIPSTVSDGNVVKLIVVLKKKRQGQTAKAS